MQSPRYLAVVAQLEQEWPLLARRELALALARWRGHQLSLRPFQRPEDLLAFLHGAAADESDGPLLALLVLAADDRAAGRFVLQAILPALKAQARRLATRSTSREELWELLLFHAWEAICTYPVTRRRRRVAANLVLQVLHDTSRELRRSSQIAARAAGRAPSFRRARVRSAKQTAPGPPPRRLLHAATTAGVIRRRDAALILRTRLRDIELRRLAQSAGVSYEALLKRRQRAEQALRRWPPLQAHVRNRRLGVLTSSAAAGSRASTRPCRRRRPIRSLSQPKEGS